MMPLDVSRRGVAIYAWPPFERLDGVQTIVNCDPVQCDPAAIAAFDLGIGVIRDRAKCENELTGVIHTSTHDIQYVMTAGLAQRADTAGEAAGHREASSTNAVPNRVLLPNTATHMGHINSRGGPG